jgi:hypothetical protein
MKTNLAASLLAVLGGATALLMPGTSQAGNVGYFDMCGGNQAAHANAITIAGHTPIAVTTPDAETLSNLDVLSVTNCDNGSFGSNYTSNLAAITAAVNAGMVLIVHDRFVTGAGSILPGGGGITTVRSTDPDDIDFPVGSPIINGPGGTLTDTSLDNGSSSTHGYVVRASLPAGGSALAIRPTNGEEDGFPGCDAYNYTSTKLYYCRKVCESGYTGSTLAMWIRRWIDRYHEDPPCLGAPSVGDMEGATVQYPHGDGLVIYSTIPLDYYLGGSGSNPPRDNFNNVYLPNVIGWALPQLPD